MKLKSLYMVIGAILFLIIGVFIVYNEKKNKLNRALNKVVFTEISNLKQNEFSKIKGKVITATTPLTSPLSKKECVYYSFKIQENKKTGKNNSWNTIHFEEQAQDFLVENNNTSALIKPSTISNNFETSLQVDKTVTDFTKQNSSKRIEAFLEEYKTKANPNVGFGISIRAIESIIQAGDMVTVAGTVNSETEGSFSKTNTLEGNANQKLIITDFSLTDPEN